MPRYDYKCNACRTITEVVQKFTDDALTLCDVCNGPISKSYETVYLSVAAMGTRSDAADIEAGTKIMHKDVAAYRRLRKDGLQPKSTKGAAALEQRANSRWEVETGMNLGGSAKLGRQFDQAQAAINAGQAAEL